MRDRLIIATKVKKTIEFIDKTVVNYPNKENNLKNRIINSGFELLEEVYYANMTKDVNSMKSVMVKIKMLDYYLKLSYEKKLISEKKYETSGNYLLEINKMVKSWINNETSK